MKLSPEIIARIRSLELHTKKVMGSTFSGNTRTRHKGSGFEFDQIREFQPGDDIRFIDWKGSARSNKLLVRQYYEERSRTIMLMVDGSASGLFGSSHERKYDLYAQVASVIALVGSMSKDAVGLTIFNDQVQRIIPPARGRTQALKIMEALFAFEPAGHTNLCVPFEQITRLKRRDVMAFVVSDFIDYGDEKKYTSLMRQAARAADVIALRVLDMHEREQPTMSAGYITIEDIETGEAIPVRIGGYNGALGKLLNHRCAQQDEAFRSYRIDTLDLIAQEHHHDAYIPELIQFFAQRAARR